MTKQIIEDTKSEDPRVSFAAWLQIERRRRAWYVWGLLWAYDLYLQIQWDYSGEAA